MDAPEPPKPSVLVVEDQPVERRLLVKLLELEGCAVRTAGSAEEALPLLAAEVPALLCLDLNLPGVSGFELAARLRAQDRTRRLPILALSSTAGPSAGSQALAAGCDAFLPKPLDVRGFPAVLGRLLGRSRA